jgi:hypothetical protein
MSGEMKAIVGTCSAVEQKPDSEWMRFMVDVEGDKYPHRLDTRDQDVITAAKGVGAQVATWTFNEVESDKINPRSGKLYINRYLEGVELGGAPGSGAASSSSGGGTSGTMTNADWDAKERRDFRSRAWAQTLATFDHTIKPEDDPILVFEKLKPFQRKLYEDVTRELSEGESDTPESTLSPADDDIPF